MTASLRKRSSSPKAIYKQYDIPLLFKSQAPYLKEIF